jgi:thymidine phosphorylase
MLAQEVIRRKRDGQTLGQTEIKDFIRGLTDGTVSDAQAAALAMAVCCRGMTREEAVGLTLAMRDSGSVMDWQLAGPVVDKHSTGGIGDNVSLMLAPMLAAAGAFVPMISGRGLGHTGGTLDKLDAIPGYQSQPGLEKFKTVVAEAGAAIIGQTADLAPADKRLYAIRDVTATVESIPLITASILSKKLAAGLESLVLDVKCGNGAFMANREAAEALARSLVEVANGAGVKTAALLTDMNEPLADAAGNAVEVANAVAFLKGEKAGTRLDTVTFALAAEMLVQAGTASDRKSAEIEARKTLESGAAAEIFARMVRALGGPADFMDKPDAYLVAAPVIRPVLAPGAGYLTACETRDVGIAVLELGGGRKRPQDGIDHRVGFTDLKPLGTKLEKGEPLAIIHAADEASAEAGAARLLAAYSFGEAAPEVGPAILKRIA